MEGLSMYHWFAERCSFCHEEPIQRNEGIAVLPYLLWKYDPHRSFNFILLRQGFHLRTHVLFCKKVGSLLWKE